MEWSKVGEPPDPPGEKSGGGGGGSRRGSILRKGLWLGKNIAIAGVAITSAPVVIPPLVIFSTLGIAFSVPFGVFFAGYACTEKIMSFLLGPKMDTPESATEVEISGELELEEGEEGGDLVLGLEGEGELMGEGGDQKAVDPVRGGEVESNASPERELLAVDPAVGKDEIFIEHEIVAAPAAEKDEIFIEQSSMSSEYTSAAEDHSLDATDVESSYSVEPLVLKAVVPLGGEVIYNEEKMWEQIAAMRAIVGYTASPHSSFMEELKALYLFTGVEPPISPEECYDLVDINDKLRFLKSVIGVK